LLLEHVKNKQLIREEIMKYNRVVIKVGTAILNQNDELSKERIYNLVELIAELKKKILKLF